MKKRLLKVSGAIAVLSVILVCVTGMLVQANPKMLQVKGSDTMINLGQAWAEAFMKKTHTPVAVVGGGSGTGFAALINRTCDIAEASRGIKAEEVAKASQNRVSPNAIVMAWDGISVVVNPHNPVKRLTEAQLSDIYTGKITNWNAVGGSNAKIVVLTRDTTSGTYAYFKEHIIQRDNTKSPADYTRDAIMQQSNQAIHDEVAGNVKAIGYIGLGYVSKRVHALAISAGNGKPFVSPSVKTVKNKTYPISRPLYWYTNGKPQGDVKKFVDFALGSEGQAIVAKLDFVPLK